MRLWGTSSVEPSRRAEPVAPTGRFVAAPWVLSTYSYVSPRRTEWGDTVHHEHELLWSGGGVVTVEALGRLWLVPSSVGIWIPAGVSHRVRADPGTVTEVAFFDPGLVQPAWEGIVGIGITGVVRELMGHNSTAVMPDDVRLDVQRLVVRLLAPLEVASLDVRLPAEPGLRRVAEAILADPSDGRTTADWALVVGTSGRTLARAFVRETGVTLTRWRILVRMRQALMDLAAGVPVTAVAARVGYANPSTFIDLFRESTGHTPAAYYRTFGVGGG